MNKELGMRLEAGLDEIAPKLVDRILEQELRPITSEAELFGEEANVSVIRQMPPMRKTVWKKLYGAAAGLAAMFVLFVCLGEVRASNVIEGQIIVDVNPSVALSVNQMGRVRNVEALNEDGVSIVDGLSKKKGTIETVLANVFTSLETQDYLKSEKAGVLVSYCYEKESTAVETKIQSAIVSLSGSRQNCTIYSQTFARANDEEEKAKTVGVSVGKYYFVNKIKEESSVLEEVSYDQTMEEIVQIMDDQGVQVAGVEVYTGGGNPMVGSDTELPGTEDGSVQTTENGGEPSGNAPETDESDTEPTVETPGSEDAGTEHPIVELPGTEEPGTEIPSTEEPGTEEPGTEIPSTEEPETEIPGTEEPGTEEAGADPKTEVDVGALVIEWVQAALEEDGKVHVAWDSPEGVSGYEIYYRNTGKKTYEKIAENVTGTSCAISGLVSGRSYLFRIVPYLVVDGERYCGEGQISDIVEIVPPQKEPGPSEDPEQEGGMDPAGAQSADEDPEQESQMPEDDIGQETQMSEDVPEGSVDGTQDIEGEQETTESD